MEEAGERVLHATRVLRLFDGITTAFSNLECFVRKRRLALEYYDSKFKMDIYSIHNA